MNLYSTHKNPEHKIIPEVFFYKYGLGVVKGKRRKKRVRKKKKKTILTQLADEKLLIVSATRLGFGGGVAARGSELGPRFEGILDGVRDCDKIKSRALLFPSGCRYCSGLIARKRK